MAQTKKSKQATNLVRAVDLMGGVKEITPSPGEIWVVDYRMDRFCALITEDEDAVMEDGAVIELGNYDPVSKISDECVFAVKK